MAVLISDNSGGTAAASGPVSSPSEASVGMSRNSGNRSLSRTIWTNKRTVITTSGNARMCQEGQLLRIGTLSRGVREKEAEASGVQNSLSEASRPTPLRRASFCVRDPDH